MTNFGKYLAMHSTFLAALAVSREGPRTDAAAYALNAAWMNLTPEERVEAKTYQEASFSPTLRAYLLAEERVFQLVQAEMDMTQEYEDAYDAGCDAWYALSEEDTNTARKMYELMREPDSVKTA